MKARKGESGFFRLKALFISAQWQRLGLQGNIVFRPVRADYKNDWARVSLAPTISLSHYMVKRKNSGFAAVFSFYRATR